jgi:hypothetical protein
MECTYCFKEIGDTFIEMVSHGKRGFSSYYFCSSKCLWYDLQQHYFTGRDSVYSRDLAKEIYNKIKDNSDE